MPKRNAGPKLHWREDRNVWEILWYEGGQTRRKSTGTADRAEADRKLSRHIIESLSHATPLGPKRPDERLICDMLADYAEERGEVVSSKATLGYSLKALLPYWGTRYARDIREGTCRAYVQYRVKEGVSDQTAGRELSVLKASIRHDYDAGRLTEVVACWRPPVPEGKDRWLTRTEAAALIRAARKDSRSRWHLPLFILLALYTAGRKEAILSLRWPQVDIDRRLIDLNPEGRAQTSKGRPTLPIPGHLLTFLRYARKRGSDLGPVLHYRGRPIKDIKRGFESACAVAGLDDVTPHTLRHTAASWMTQSGVPFPVIARFLGHADSRITEQKYCHHAPDYLGAAVDALDRRRKR